MCRLLQIAATGGYRKLLNNYGLRCPIGLCIGRPNRAPSAHEVRQTTRNVTRLQHYQLRRGLNLPVQGEPLQDIHTGPTIRTVALLGSDYVGLKPRLLVQENDTVAPG
ncbi:MAG: hypothetical protein AAF986_02585, partial [Pseudomonadota bacterium]